MELLVEFLNVYIANDIIKICIGYLSDFDKYLMKLIGLETNITITKEDKDDFFDSIVKKHIILTTNMFIDFLLNMSMINDTLDYICLISPFVELEKKDIIIINNHNTQQIILMLKYKENKIDDETHIIKRHMQCIESLKLYEDLKSNINKYHVNNDVFNILSNNLHRLHIFIDCKIEKIGYTMKTLAGRIRNKEGHIRQHLINKRSNW